MFEGLSAKQREIVFDKSGKFVVRACPGSGKTFCVSARLARLISTWNYKCSGIAAMSFTNVAWQEIEKKYKERFTKNSSIDFPHFLGTIDAFINRYIFLPFGHLVLYCKNRPALVGEPHGIWTGKYFSQSFFDNLTFDISGNIYALNPRIMPPNWEKNAKIESEKRKLIAAGYATQPDANYFAMKILEAYPQIAKSIVLRFPYLIIDEAQDTSEIQMKIVDLLIMNGLKEIMLVGDPDQAIFEWNNARPDLLDKKFTDWPDSVILNESRRSSQKICDFTFNLSSLTEVSISIDEEVKDLPHVPKIVEYVDGKLNELVSAFLKECEMLGISTSKKSVAVLYRSRGMANRILEVKELPFNVRVWTQFNSYTKDFTKGKYLYDIGEYKHGFKLIKKAVIKLINGLSHCRDEDIDYFHKKYGIKKFRGMIQELILSLPKTDIAIGHWVDQANKILKISGTDKELVVEKGGRNIMFRQVFLNDSEDFEGLDYRMGTVHSAKGETFDATLLILQSRGIGKAYKTLLKDGTPISESEEMRIAYVGMTRPRKYLVVATPDQQNRDAWSKRLLPE